MRIGQLFRDKGGIMKLFRSRSVQRVRSLLVVLLLMAAAGHRVEAQQPGMPPEVIAYADIAFYNGKALTADDTFTIAEAVSDPGGQVPRRGNDRSHPANGGTEHSQSRLERKDGYTANH